MVFSSIPFIFFFLPLFFILYFAVYLLGRRYGKLGAANKIILIFSLIFYAWGEVKCLPLMLFVALNDYLHVRFSSGLQGPEASLRTKKRFLLISSLAIDLLLLGFFKYADFLVGIANSLVSIAGAGIDPLPLPNIALPVGISFFTFQSMSYSIDYYRGEVEPENSYLDYLTYVSMFPQLVAGPIVRYSDISEKLHQRHITPGAFSEGLTRLSLGLFKKVLIANQLGKLWDAALSLSMGSNISLAFSWLGAAAFTLQLYFDFSAYSDMAIGMGQMMGFTFPENFRYPLSAISITDFWRKWHISLSSWFRDYVYIPLGGNRCSIPKHLRNMFVVWFLTGLWHGASWNFVIWGLWHGVFLALEKYIWGRWIEKLPRVIRHFYALFIVITGFTIFAVDDMGALLPYLSHMFGSGIVAGMGTDFLWYLSNYGLLFVIALILAFPAYPALIKMAIPVITDKISSASKPLGTPIAGYLRELLKWSLICLLFVVSIAFLVSDSYNPFLYFRF